MLFRSRLSASGEVSLTEIIRRLSIEPCRVFGLPYGGLAVGAPADLVLFDATAEWTVDTTQFLSKGKNTPLEGHRLRGLVGATLVEGEVVFERTGL